VVIVGGQIVVPADASVVKWRNLRNKDLPGTWLLTVNTMTKQGYIITDEDTTVKVAFVGIPPNSWKS
jgi:hypothetical protein